MSETQLCKDAAQGSLAAFTSLVTLHQQALRAFLRRLTGNWAEADDLAQDVFFDVWQQLPRLDPQLGFRSWLFGIAYRKYLMQRRSWWRRLRREQFAVLEEAVHANEQHHAWLDLRRALQALVPEQRAVVALCVAGDWSHQEAAHALNLPLGTVKSHLRRSRVLLGQHLAGYSPTQRNDHSDDYSDDSLGATHESNP